MSAIAKERQSMRAQLDELDRNRDKLHQERASIDAELAGVEAERGKIEFALEVLDRLDAEPEVSPQRSPYALLTRRRIEGGSADFALRALAALGTPSTAEEVMEQMKVLGWDADSVARPVEVARNALIRATQTGEVHKAGRGKYVPASAEPEQQNEEPANTVSAFGVDHGEPLPPPIDF